MSIEELKEFIDYDIILLYLEDKKIKTLKSKNDNYILFFNHFLKAQKIKVIRRSRIRRQLDN
jgi:hypothetical protein